jgi:hypothetical protein
MRPSLEVAMHTIAILEMALEPLAKAAEAYESGDLDEARPTWGHGLEKDKKVSLISGRGGKALVSLADAFKAREALALGRCALRGKDIDTHEHLRVAGLGRPALIVNHINGTSSAIWHIDDDDDRWVRVFDSVHTGMVTLVAQDGWLGVVEAIAIDSSDKDGIRGWILARLLAMSAKPSPRGRPPKLLESKG